MSAPDYFASVKEAARGRWARILTDAGIPASSLRDKHGPCPACRGEDRFRFDDKDGEGTFYCNKCGPGDGFQLLERVRKISRSDSLAHVADWLGFERPSPKRAELYPQWTGIEGGYLAFPHVLLDAAIASPLPGDQARVLLYMLRTALDALRPGYWGASSYLTSEGFEIQRSHADIIQATGCGLKTVKRALTAIVKEKGYFSIARRGHTLEGTRYLLGPDGCERIIADAHGQAAEPDGDEDEKSRLRPSYDGARKTPAMGSKRPPLRRPSPIRRAKPVLHKKCLKNQHPGGKVKEYSVTMPACDSLHEQTGGPLSSAEPPFLGGYELMKSERDSVRLSERLELRDEGQGAAGGEEGRQRASGDAPGALPDNGEGLDALGMAAEVLNAPGRLPASLAARVPALQKRVSEPGFYDESAVEELAAMYPHLRAA